MIKKSISELFHYFQNLHVMLWITANSDLPTAQLLVIYNKISSINLLMNWYWLYILWAGNVSKVIVISFPKWTSMNFPYCIKCKNQLKKSNWFNTTWFQSMLMAPDEKFHSPISIGRGMILFTYNMLWIE